MNSHQQQGAVRKVLQDVCEEMKYMPTRTNVNNEIEVVYNTVFRLSHVLRAMGEKSIRVDTQGWFYYNLPMMNLETGDYDLKWKVSERWDLTKDDLSLQSPETIEFLFNILCE